MPTEMTSEIPQLIRDLPPMDFRRRLESVRSLIGERRIDALYLIHSEENPSKSVRYLTGFTGSHALVVVTDSKLHFVTDGRYGLQAQGQLANAGLRAELEVPASGQGFKDAVLAAVAHAQRVGVEEGSITRRTSKKLESEWFVGKEVLDTEDLVEGLRVVKDQGEIERVRLASRYVDEALAAVLPMLLEGPTEIEFGRELDFEIKRRGADGNSFETIVAAGLNGAKPHHRPSDYRIQRGDFVTIDVGAEVHGYCSDMTRTVSVGDPRDPVLRRVWEVVLDSQRLGVAAARNGVAGVEVDRVCRERIAAEGWGEAFSHSTGHGVGLDVHEAPSVSARSTDTLATGQIATVEPGIYLAEHGGVRIEDSLAILDEGNDVLTTHNKKMVVE